MRVTAPEVEGVPPGLDALFASHWLAMVRLAVLLVDDRPTAEDVVQDACTGTGTASPSRPRPPRTCTGPW